MRDYLKLIRVEQYLKNLFVFAPLFFGRQFFEMNLLWDVSIIFICFSLAASGIYIFNDYLDINEDRLHPQKSKRPLASSKIAVKKALILMILLEVSSLVTSYIVSKPVFYIILLYLIMNVCYSKWLKHIAILDVNIIAIGFVLRLLAGGFTANVIPSEWIVLITFLLAMFLGLSKRRTDVIHAQNGKTVRKNIASYSLTFIDIILAVLAGIIIVCYIFYCISPDNEQNYHSTYLYFSTIFVINGLLRYLKITIVDQASYSPTLVLLKDLYIQVCFVLWFLFMGYLLYFNV